MKIDSFVTKIGELIERLARQFFLYIDNTHYNAYNTNTIYERRLNRFLKRKDIIKILLDNGYELRKSSGPHDVYVKSDGSHIALPRHTEISEGVAKQILKKARGK